jgi:hypothetical protein
MMKNWERRCSEVEAHAIRVDGVLVVSRGINSTHHWWAEIMGLRKSNRLVPEWKCRDLKLLGFEFDLEKVRRAIGKKSRSRLLGWKPSQDTTVDYRH